MSVLVFPGAMSSRRVFGRLTAIKYLACIAAYLAFLTAFVAIAAVVWPSTAHRL